MGRESDTEPDVDVAGPTAVTIPGPSPRPPQPELQPGLPIGRYLLIGPIGEGGMGVVYAAYDPKLDRKVALKFVREAESERGQTRLLREAHAMAKLSHPNVLPIYDVGTFRGRVFLALELVEGATLEEWLETKRTPGQIMAAYLGAARGLAAAHSAELVHRDFKPSNVLIGNDGRVRVTDFGLARADRDSESEPESSRNLLDEQLTVDGSIMGTLAYMAPEQRRAVPADARSDQFAFCISLYEGLYGEPPFAGDGEARWAAIEAGRVREPKKGTNVPPYVRRVLLRGLAVDPEQRYPSMDALSKALRADPAAARRRLLFPTIAALVAVALVLAVLALRTDQVTPCRGSEDKLAGIWDDATRDTLASHFTSLDKGFATDAWTRTRALVDGYTTRWATMRRDVCEATRVRAEQSEAVMTLRISCLDRRLDRLRALVAALGSADADAASRSADAARSLERLEECADIVEDRIKPPDAERLARVGAMRAELAKLQVLFDLGKYEAGRDATAQLAIRAAELGYRPLEAQVRELHAMYVRRDGRQDEEPVLLAAFVAAEASSDDRRKARLALKLAHANSFAKLDFKRAGEWLDHGSAILEAIGGDRELEGLLLHERGNVFIRQGRYAESLIWYRKALAVREQVNNGQWALMETLHNIGIAEKESGSIDKALVAMSEAARIVEAMLGPSHPEMVDELENLSWVQIAANQKVEGLASSERALHLAKQAFGPSHPRTGVAMLYAASALNVNDRFAEGAQIAHRATELALDVERRLDAHTVEGKALGGLGKHREAVATLETGLAQAEKELGPDNPALSRVLVELGNQQTKLGARAVAIPVLERALRLRKDSNAEGRAEVAYLLAVALFDQDRTRSLTLARQARETFAKLAHHAPDLVEIDKWLAAHP